MAKAGLAQVQLLQRTVGVDPVAARAAAEQAPPTRRCRSWPRTSTCSTAPSTRPSPGWSRRCGRRGDDRNAARAHLVELFTVVGPDDERVAKARRALTAALF
jgi:putative thioredoxin